jgi:serine/threonine protein kinase
LLDSLCAADLKPANILLDTATGRAKISDFGLARQHLSTTMDTLHLGVGTLPYMAPELLASAHMGVAAVPATNRIDIYAFGALMWEMLAGRPPWSHLNQSAMLAAVRAPNPVCAPGPVLCAATVPEWSTTRLWSTTHGVA